MTQLARKLMCLLVCVCAAVTVRTASTADVCENPAVFTGSSSDSGAAAWFCSHDETGWNLACDQVCSEGGGDHWWGAPTGSCSTPQICGYVNNTPIYCSSIVLECHRDELEEG